MSYIINSRNEVIAYTEKHYKSGLEVAWSYDSCEESINADRELNLVNRKYGKISNAKKWKKECGEDFAVEINEDEFLVK